MCLICECFREEQRWTQQLLNNSSRLSLFSGNFLFVSIAGTIIAIIIIAVMNDRLSAVHTARKHSIASKSDTCMDGRCCRGRWSGFSNLATSTLSRSYETRTLCSERIPETHARAECCTEGFSAEFAKIGAAIHDRCVSFTIFSLLIQVLCGD